MVNLRSFHPILLSKRLKLRLIDVSEILFDDSSSTDHPKTEGQPLQGDVQPPKGGREKAKEKENENGKEKEQEKETEEAKDTQNAKENEKEKDKADAEKEKARENEKEKPKAEAAHAQPSEGAVKLDPQWAVQARQNAEVTRSFREGKRRTC